MLHTIQVDDVKNLVHPYIQSTTVLCDLSLSSLSSDNLSIKRKYKNINSSSAQRWWFVVRADEPLLQKLDSQWDTIALQTSWQLTPLLQYIPASEIMHARIFLEKGLAPRLPLGRLRIIMQ